ncbi:Protein RER1D [Cardamine amara subsp. amara]|uniref:Protein RER1 n=1 Tax=Cardamine amara subsp. amara TaxID=228776 RepID=A0ABD1B509_CARAN
MEDEPGSENEGDTMVASPLAKWRIEFSRSFQNHLDRSAPHLIRRWLVTLVAGVIYIYRVYYVYGFFVISYGLATYILNLLIGFLSPKVDPEIEALDPTSLPRDDSDEFKPFVRRLPEFKFWYAATKAFVVAFVMTFFSFLDVPVFWPILLCYWLFLYFLTMKRQIVHMFKYRYFPFDIRKKKRHGGNDKPSSSNALERDEKPAPM